MYVIVCLLCNIIEPALLLYCRYFTYIQHEIVVVAQPLSAFNNQVYNKRSIDTKMKYATLLVAAIVIISLSGRRSYRINQMSMKRAFL